MNIANSNSVKAICLTALFLISANSLEAQGVLYVSNIANPSDFAFNWGGFATSFTTGTESSGYDLNSVQLNIGGVDGPSGGYSISLCSDDVGLPGSDLQTLTGTAPTGAGVYSYTSPILQLSPSTTYWIVMICGNACWAVPDSGDYTSSDGWSMGSDADWDGSSWSQDSSYPFELSVIASPVSEPSPLAIVLLSTGLIFYISKRFQFRSTQF